MGLGVSHNCWHGSYSAFSRWRQALADAAGYMSFEVIYDNGERSPGRTIFFDWGHLQDKLHGEWDKTPDDPLLVLITHSDCGGIIKPEQAGPLADRLEFLLPLLPKEPVDWSGRTRDFIDGLRLAAANGESVDFH